MTDSEFEVLADGVLARIEQAIDSSGLDVDLQSKAGGVLEVEFENGTKMVINRHGTAKEIWVAAKSGGFHFHWDGSAWRDTRDDSELFAALSRLISAQGGQGVVLHG